MFKYIQKLVVLVFLSLPLISCGGGGGSSFGTPNSSNPASNISGGAGGDTTGGGTTGTTGTGTGGTSVNVTNGNGVATVSWTAPTQNTDDTTLTDLAGFKIYFGTSPSSLTNSVTIANPSVNSYVLDNLTNGITVYFAVVAYNNSGIESYLSNITSKST